MTKATVGIVIRWSATPSKKTPKLRRSPSTRRVALVSSNAVRCCGCGNNSCTRRARRSGVATTVSEPLRTVTVNGAPGGRNQSNAMTLHGVHGSRSTAMMLCPLLHTPDPSLPHTPLTWVSSDTGISTMRGAVPNIMLRHATAPIQSMQSTMVAVWIRLGTVTRATPRFFCILPCMPKTDRNAHQNASVSHIVVGRV